MAVTGEDFLLRAAQADDDPHIRKLIHHVGINPLGLRWERFTLAVDQQRKMIGCGQVKQHGDGSRELASIAVVESWRGRGVAGAIIRHLLQSEGGRLYLTCRLGLGPFYQHFGFREAAPGELSPYFRRLNRLASMLRALRLMPGEGLLFMIRENLST